MPVLFVLCTDVDIVETAADFDVGDVDKLKDYGKITTFQALQE